MDKTKAHPRNAHFGTTRWSVVIRASGDGSEDARQALSTLVELYWYPLYAFARRQGNNDHDSMDLTQGFFAHLLAASALGTVAPEKGRFRSFLMASFTNFIANQRRAATAIRRGGSASIVPLSTLDFQSRYDREPVDNETPEMLFQRSWVQSLLSAVKTQLHDEYRAAHKDELFALLEPHLTHRDDAMPRTEISRNLNLSAAAVAMSLHRMRRRYGELLREHVAATVDDPAEVEEELHDLMEIVSNSASW